MSYTKKEPNPIDVYVGSRIRLQRNLKNMTQQQLSGRLGITFQQIQKYEKGMNRVGASRLQEIAEILSVPVSFFFSKPDEDDAVFPPGAPGFAEEADDRLLSDCTAAEGTELMRAFTRIKDRKVRRKIIDLTQTLADSRQMP